MDDEQVPSDDTTAELAATPTAPTTSDEPVEIPQSALSRKSTRFGRSQQLLAAGAAGLLVVGGLAGFGIGRATGGDDGPRFARLGQFGPGQQGFGRPGERGHFGGNSQRGPGVGPGQMPNGPLNGQPGAQPSQPTPSPSTSPS